MERSEKIKLLKMLQTGGMSREEFARKAGGPSEAHVVIYRGSFEAGPFFVGGKEYSTREALDEFLSATRSKACAFLPEKKVVMYLPDNGRSLF